MSPKLNFLANREKSPVLEMVVGNEQGKLFPVSGQRLRIGRSDENEIVLPTEGVSRNHAVLEQQPNGQWFIRDNQSKNGVLVNGVRVDRAVLRTGDIIQIGHYSFRFDDAHSREAAAEDAQGVPNYGEMALSQDFSQIGEKKGPNKRLLIYGGVVLLLLLFYFSQSETPTGDKAAENSGTKASDFKVSEAPDLSNNPEKPSVPGLEDPALSKAEQETGKVDWNNTPVKEAEQFFKRGQREYLVKNYGRAIEFFQTAISLNRGHELANKYLRLAVYEAETEAKKQWEMAVKYFESLQYQRAIYHFNQVISLMSHRPTESIVGQSEKYVAIAKRRLQQAELFP